ncbi:L-threonylcarbamoyladenylate synthase [Parahalioglobus pacificus]|uniref:Threonylcarbamoyl-AMP synthase n=1 Tax=Parahalioglobus pacificus TaxID=930806 RepID=A0A918XCZ8_9GAMM|nr:L-threonylcarbamoyladenylate synthase [Halioglobus pacificus]NQY02594.1 threonylcarbamoyl-AMP synthase [Halieaceae bacterium]GHD26439.1 threonylcarbamoyl-AMP synthase [Halioglobus pacificus]
MSQFFQIHPDNPQARLVRQAVDIVRGGGIIAYPTDSAYALGCHIGDKNALDRIRRIRKLDDRHNFTLVCRDLSEIATYARVDNQVYRLLKSCTPGPYTFILRATSEVPRRLMHAKRKTVGLRVPDNEIALSLLRDLDEPLMSVTLVMPGDDYPLIDPYEIREVLEHHVDLVIDGGYCGMEATTVVDLADEVPLILRAGKGDLAPFEA